MMLAALNISETIHDLTDWIVCDRENKDCMLHRCENCPGIESMLTKLRETVVEQHLGSGASENEKKCFLNEIVLKFGQWTSTDRADLVYQTMVINDFLDKFDTFVAYDSK